MIMTGVQISATALDAALGAGGGAAGMVVVDRVDGSSVDGSLLGKEFVVSIPRAEELSQCAAAAAGGARDISRQAGECAVYCREEMHTLYRGACEALTVFLKESGLFQHGKPRPG
jgi:hypothetical protein